MYMALSGREKPEAEWGGGPQAQGRTLGLILSQWRSTGRLNRRRKKLVGKCDQVCI
jgi:hypothetical protein